MREESQGSAFLRTALYEAGFGGQSITSSSLPPETLSSSILAPPTPPPPPLVAPGLVRAPLGIGPIRLQLFELVEPVLFSAEEFTAAWPFVSNVWKSSSKSAPSGSSQKTYFRCRFHNATTAKSQGKGLREKSIRKGMACPMRCRVVVDLISGVHTIEKTSGDAHNHSLDDSDRNKRPQPLMSIAGAEVANGYPIAAVANTMRASHLPRAEERLEDAGGRFLRRQDVANASRGWRKANPNPRFVAGDFE